MIPSLSSLFAKSFPGTWGPFASALANHLWQSTLFAVAAALLTLALKNNHARTRYWLWFIASAKFLFPFSLLIALGTHLAWLHPTAKPITAANTATYFVMQEVSQPFDLAPLPTPAPPPVLSRTARLRATLGGSFFPPALALIWLAGFLFVLIRWVTRWFKIAAVLRTAPTLTTGREAEALDRITTLAGLKRTIAIKSLPIAIEPGIFGIFRPVLLWPEGISSHLDDAQLESVIAHEICHVRRRDNLTAALHMAVEAIFWFHPLVWWLQTRLVAERETACDEEVLTLLGPTCTCARAYAESILKVCEYSIVSPLPCISGVTGADLRRRIAAIVTAHSLTCLSWPKKILILAAALCVATAPVVLGMVKMVPLYGQILHSDSPLPSFEVATIRPTQISGFVAPAGIDPSKIVHAREVRITSVPFSDQVEQIMTAKTLIADAYRLPAFSKAQLIGGPDWADQTMYQLKAKIGDVQYAAMLKIPSEQQQTQVRLMEQSLLADRFQLRVHFETREVPVYALQLAKGGPKLTPAKIDSPPAESATGAPQTPPSTMNMTGKGDGFKIQGKNVSAAQLILLLQQQPEVGNRLMVDKTGLTAKYDLTLDWTRDLTASADAEPAPTDAAPSLFTALKDQLGLELVETKAPIEVIVIDHIEKPTLDGAEVQPANLVPAALAQVQTRQKNIPDPDTPTDVVNGLTAPKLEVLSIKQNVSTSGMSDMGLTADGLTVTNTPLLMLIHTAFDGHFSNGTINGLPGWEMNRYDIVGKISEADVGKLSNLTQQQKIGMIRTMLRTVLEDRFQMRWHDEDNQGPVFDLVVAKAGPKLAEASPGQIAHDPIMNQRGIFRGMFTMSDLAHNLSGPVTGRVVIDKTGLNGRYDLTLTWTPDQGIPAPESAVASAPSIFTAVEEQLGLKLEPSKAPVKRFVIDHIQRPSEN